MSDTIQHKLYQYELVPPEKVWNRIAEELDSTTGDPVVASKLKELQILPPQNSWNKIVAALETVPATMDLGAKLLAAEVIPPANTWDKIASALSEEQAELAPRRRIAPIWRYAAAAVLIGLVSWAALSYFGTSKEKETVATTITEDKPTNNTPSVANNNPELPAPVVTGPDVDEARNDAALEESKRTFARLDVSARKRKKIASGFHFSGFTSDNNTVSPGDLSAAVNIADRYVVLMTPDGHFIRMSKKLSSNLVCCVSGEEQDLTCRDQVEKWRKQLACASASHPGNFFDILSLVSSLEDQ